MSENGKSKNGATPHAPYEPPGSLLQCLEKRKLYIADKETHTAAISQRLMAAGAASIEDLSPGKKLFCRLATARVSDCIEKKIKIIKV